MAQRASRFVQVHVCFAVQVHEVGHVAGGFELCHIGMAVLACEGRFDLRVAHETVRHLGQGGARHLVRLFESPVASLARVGGIEVPADVAGRLQVSLVVDGRSDVTRSIAHLQMERVAEFGNASRRRRGDLGVLVTLQTDPLGGQQVIFHSRTGRRGAVAIEASQPDLQVRTMREWRGG